MPTKEAFARAYNTSDLGISEYKEKPAELIAAMAWGSQNGAYEHLGKLMIVIQFAHVAKTKTDLTDVTKRDKAEAVEFLVSIAKRMRAGKSLNAETSKLLPMLARVAIEEYINARCRGCNGSRWVRTERDVSIECPRCLGSGLHIYGTKERLEVLEHETNDPEFVRSAWKRLQQPLNDMAGIIGFAVKVQHEAAVRRLGK